VLVGLVALVLGPALFLFVRPFVVRGGGILAAFALIIGGAALGLLAAGLAAHAALRAEPARLPRALALGTAVGLVAAFPGLLWAIWLGRFIAAGEDFWGNEWLAAQATLVLELPVLAAALGLTAWARCRRRVAEWAPVRPVPRWAPRLAWGTAGTVLLTAWLWPGGRPGPQTAELIEGRTPHEWIGLLSGEQLGDAQAALLRAGSLAAPDLLADIESRQGARWAVAEWFGVLASRGGHVASLLESVEIPWSNLRLAELMLRRHRDEAAPLGAVLASNIVRRDIAVQQLSATLRAVGGAALPEACAVARAGLHGDDPLARLRAVLVCLALGPAACPTDDAVAVLVSALRDPRPEVVKLARSILQAGRPATRAAVPALLGMMRGDDAAVVRDAALALVLLARSDSEVARLVREGLSSAEVDHRFTVPQLESIGIASPSVLAALQTSLKTAGTTWAERLAIAGRLGRDGAALLPVMEPLLQDVNPFVQRAAALASLKIGGPTPARLAPLRALLGAAPPRTPWNILGELWDHPEWVPLFEAELTGLLAAAEPRVALNVAGLLLRAGLAEDACVALLDGDLRKTELIKLGEAWAAADACRRCGPAAHRLLPALRAFRDGPGLAFDLAYDAVDAVEGRR